MIASEFAERLGACRSGDGWSARCPAHPDRNPSVSISEGDNGNVLVHCHAGCATADVVAAMGLRMSDLTASDRRDEGEIIYRYTDEEGRALFEVVRRPGKLFSQRPANGKRGAGSMRGVPLVLYRLPDVVQGVSEGLTVFVVEGEKDANRLAADGWIATTNPMGAGKWSKVAAHARSVLAGADVVVVQDRDEPGRRHAAEVVRSLDGVAASVKLVESAQGKDVSDHLNAGLTIEDLLVVDAHEHPEDETTGEAFDELVDESFRPVDLGPVLDGDASQPEPTILRRNDRRALFYAGQVNGLHGDSGIGKGWITGFAIAQQMRAGRNVMLIDAEDVAPSIVARLRLLGATDNEIRTHLIYVRPSAPFGMFAVDHLESIVLGHNVSLVVIDSLGECFGLDGINEDKDNEVGPWLRRVTRRLADAGPAVVLVDHATKSNDNPLHPSGSKRKRAAIGGASYLLTAPQPLTSDAGGRLSLTCAKDRHGSWARGEHVADFVMTVDIIGTRAELYAVERTVSADLPVELAARAAVEAARNLGHPISLKVLRESMAFKGRTETKGAGIDLAVSRGDLTEQPGPRNARLFSIPQEPES